MHVGGPGGPAIKVYVCVCMSEREREVLVGLEEKKKP